ncbi:MAG: glycosyltransferase family 4 protein, partial [Phycisphaerae bacterium]|nr:glycosyltransferase family 4 protein [Gemmatimonadaceae bacterium]
MLETLASCVLVRAAMLSTHAATSDARWPGFAPVFAVLERGTRGHLLREPLLSYRTKPSSPPMAGAIVELRAKGLTDAVLGDLGADPAPSPEPLQSLDEQPLPDVVPVRANKRPANGQHRVLVLLQGFPMGGYTAFNADFLPRLVKRGHVVTVCTTEMWRTDWRLDAVRASNNDVVHAGGVVPLTSMPRYVSHLIASREIDVVLVSHSLAGYRMLPWLRRQHPGTAFVDYVHTDWFEAQMYGSYAALGAAHADWLDVQVASSRTLANDLVRRGTRLETTIAQPINLDTTDWDPSRFPAAQVRASLGCSAAQPLILFAGRLSGEKRPLLAVECWKALIASGVDARFAVAGNGPLLGAMVDAVEKAGLKGRVEFLGELDGDMLRYVYSAADVYHAPSEIEGIARSLFEAMSMGCIPVVADVGGQHELVGTDCGKLIAHGPEEVARYVRAIVAVLDPATKTRLQNAARARIVSHFTSAQCVAGFEAAFDVAVEHRAKAIGAGVPLESKSAARELALSGLETMRRHFWRAHGR